MGEKRDLTLKQKKFLKVYFETGNATKAALAAYDTTDSGVAGNIGSENLIKLQDIVRHIMDVKGLDAEKLVDTVNGAMDAKNWNDFTGEREPDHTIRLKAIEIAERWLGMKNNDEGGMKVQNNYFNLIKTKKTEFFRGRSIFLPIVIKNIVQAIVVLLATIPTSSLRIKFPPASISSFAKTNSLVCCTKLPLPKN